MRASIAVAMLLGGTAAADGDVLVWRDAALRTEPSDTSPAIHLAAIEDKREARGTVPVHVIKAQGRFVEVELDDCAVRVHDLAHVRLFVARKDLAPGRARPAAACAPASESTTVALGRDTIPQGARLETLAGRAVAVAAAPITVTAMPGAKRVCIDRAFEVDPPGEPASLRICAPARAIKRESAMGRTLKPR